MAALFIVTCSIVLENRGLLGNFRPSDCSLLLCTVEVSCAFRLWFLWIWGSYSLWVSRTVFPSITGRLWFIYLPACISLSGAQCVMTGEARKSHTVNHTIWLWANFCHSCLSFLWINHRLSSIVGMVGDGALVQGRPTGGGKAFQIAEVTPGHWVTPLESPVKTSGGSYMKAFFCRCLTGTGLQGRSWRWWSPCSTRISISFLQSHPVQAYSLGTSGRAACLLCPHSFQTFFRLPSSWMITQATPSLGNF